MAFSLHVLDIILGAPSTGKRGVKMRNRIIRVFILGGFAIIGISLVVFPSIPSQATHSWQNFHWARTSNPFNLSVVDSVTSNWDSFLRDVSSDWSLSSVLDTVIEPGATGNTERKRCVAISGKIRVCNANYGRNGWLGLASIWFSGDHIGKATAKMNDTYFTLSFYNNPNAKRHVMCQEVGHGFGLGHQTGISCMDDRNGLFDPAYVTPNAHDYEQLEIIYSHLDSFKSIASSAASSASGTDDEEIPQEVRKRRARSFTKDLGNGEQKTTFIYWAD